MIKQAASKKNKFRAVRAYKTNENNRGVSIFSINEKRAIELGNAGVNAARDNKEYEAVQNIEYLKELGEELIREKYEKDSKTVAISLRNIGSKAAQNKIEETAITAIKALRELSDQAFEKGYSDALFSLARAVQEIGKSAAKSELEKSTKYAVETLERIGLQAVEHKMEVVTLWTTLALGEIAYESGERQLEVLQETAKAVRETIIKAAEDKAFIPRAQIEIYPKLISDTIKSFGDYPDLAPAGYDATPNEEFTEEEFFEGEAVDNSEEKAEKEETE
ncbi:MAG: hypothetical protein PHV51_02760 [Methanosarcinaceae archaeon]|nr:hypothetical protein [Methanosarcinaceae archaeon]MDD4497064.1 hypothetical protein [Methanosarcinaceae archaeon]